MYVSKSSTAASSNAMTKTTKNPSSTSSSSSSSLSTFMWQDVDAFHARLDSFNAERSNICLPLEISPIICARFGWRRIPSSTENNNCNMMLLSSKDNDTNDDTNDGGGVICIKFHPLLSIQSKQKLTTMYREMLATNHTQHSPFKYDALLWWNNINNSREKGNSNESSVNEIKNDIINKKGGTKSLFSNRNGKSIVPPYLIHLSHEYEILDHYDSSSGNGNSSSSSDSNHGCRLITSFIQKQAKDLGGYYCNQKKKHNNNTKMTTTCTSTTTTTTASKSIDEKILNLISNETIQKMMDIVTSDTNFVPLLSGEDDEDEVDKDEVPVAVVPEVEKEQRIKTHHNELLYRILQKIVSNMNHNVGVTNADINDENNNNNKNKNNIGAKMRRFQDEMYDLSKYDKNSIYNNNHDEDDHHVNQQDSSSVTSTTTTTTSITIGMLLLSIFGWRLYHEDEGGQQRQYYIKCNLCLNCSPIPLDFFDNGDNDNNDGCKENELDQSTRPTKRRKFGSLEDETRSENNDVVKYHKFDLINSHRYYCPHTSGFHNKNKYEKNKQDRGDGNVTAITDDHDELGTSSPCWEIVWKSLLQSSVSTSLESFEQQTVEERFSNIRNKIRSSIVDIQA